MTRNSQNLGIDSALLPRLAPSEDQLSGKNAIRPATLNDEWILATLFFASAKSLLRKREKAKQLGSTAHNNLEEGGRFKKIALNFPLPLSRQRRDSNLSSVSPLLAKTTENEPRPRREFTFLTLFSYLSI